MASLPSHMKESNVKISRPLLQERVTKKPKRFHDKEIQCMTLNLYHEARGEPMRGILSVAHVVMNRVKSEKYPKSICGVVYQPNQFSWVAERKRVHDYRTFLKMQQLAETFLRNHQSYKSEIGNSLYFHTKSSNPSWSKHAKRKTVIGNHVFVAL